MRNIENQVKQGKEIISRHNRADMSVSECMQLMEPIGEKKDADKIHDQIYRSIMDAFYMGVAVGSRCRG